MNLLHPVFPAALNPAATCYLNGDWLRLDEAKVSVLDRGFLLGDGIYEVVPVYSRRPFGWEGHSQRLQASLAAISLDGPMPDWAEVIEGLIAREASDDQFIYIQVTRGVAKRDHAFPRPGVAPTVFAMTTPLKRPSEDERSQGLKAICLPDLRWHRCDIKSISLLGNLLAREQAVAAGAHEAILLRHEMLTEGAASNIWIVKDDILASPPRSRLLLEGIRRGLMSELAQQIGLAHQQRIISEAELRDADEILLTSATKEVLPITQLDGRPVASGRPGPVYSQLRTAYDAAIAQHRALSPTI